MFKMCFVLVGIKSLG